MSEMIKMSAAESAVMEILWNSDARMTSSQIINILQKEHEWKPSTVWTFLGRLTDKGLVRAQRVGKTNYYFPALTEEEYRRGETLHFLNSVHGGSIRSFFAALSGGKGLSAEELEELRGWLDRQVDE